MALIPFDLDALPMFTQEYGNPDQLPVSILEVDRSAVSFNMDLPMADACPLCGAFRLTVGAYVCWGGCMVCYESTMNEYDEANKRGR